MVELRATIRDQASELQVRSMEALDATLAAASAEACAEGRLNIIRLTAPSRNWLTLVVGGEETVVGFNYAHADPPYFVSVGDAQADEPVLTAYVGLLHHTEFKRGWVIPFNAGRQAAREFLMTGERPKSLKWTEV